MSSRRRIAPLGPAWHGHELPAPRSSSIADLVPPINFDIDPSLEMAEQSQSQSQRNAPVMVGPGVTVYSSNPNPPAAIPAYFRLSPQSSLIGHHPRMWLGKLASRTVDALHFAAKSKAGAASVGKIQGVVKNDDGSEDAWLIESDDELDVYLDEAGEKATFVVVLEGGYA
jgi:hypothetical protein